MTEHQSSKAPLADYTIDIEIEDEVIGAEEGEIVQRAVAATLAAAGRKRAGVSVLLTSDEVVQQLNREFRAIDAPTDVLSFPSHDEAPQAPALIVPPDLAAELAAYLGDLVIAVPYVRRQAADFGNSLVTELRLMAVHGTLHLLGYDHATPEDESRMWSAQDAVMVGLGEQPGLVHRRFED